MLLLSRQRYSKPVNILEDFISLFFPKYCVTCRRSLYTKENLICTHCFVNVAKTNSHNEKPNFIEEKFYGRVNLGSAWAYFFFQQQGIAQDILHHIKYKNFPELAEELGRRYALELKKKLDDACFDYIVPVPLYYKKFKKRGYNQSEKFANGLSENSLIPTLNALRRLNDSETQTAKTRVERWRNVKGIFELQKEEIKDKKILLVDDVITTGATIEACSKVLLDEGCVVSVLALAAAR